MLLILRLVGTAVMAAIVLVSTSLGGDNSEKWGNVTEQQWNLAAPDTVPDAKAIVIFDIGTLEVPAPYESALIDFRRHVRIKILNKAGAGEDATIEIMLLKDDRFKDFKAQTILRDGGKFEVPGKEVFRKDLTDGNRLITFTFPTIEDGCILEYRYQILHQRFNLLDPWCFQSSAYTLKSQFSVVLHTGLLYSVLMANVPEQSREPVREEALLGNEKAVTFTWVLRDLLPIPVEPFMAATQNYRAAVTCQLNSFRDEYNNITFIEDWKTMGKRVLEYYDEFLDGKGELAQTAKLLTSDQPTATDKIRRLYQFVRDEVLTQGERTTRWYEKSNVGKVLTEKTGNACEKNLLLVEMLRTVNLDASPLLIGTREHAVFNPKIYHLDQFNHLVCYVRTEPQTYCLDVGERGVPFPFLPPDDLVAGGLLLQKPESSPVSLSLPKRTNSFETTSKMRLRADGSAICSTHIRISGYSIYEYRDLLEDRPTDEKMGALLFRQNDLTFEVNEYSFGREIDGDSASVDIVLTFPSLCAQTEKQLVCAASPFWLAENPFANPKRFFPVDFNYGRSVSDVFDLECDEGLTVAATPQNAHEAMEGLNYARSVLTAGRSIRIMSQLIISKTVYVPSHYTELRSIFGRIAEAAAEPTTITH